MTNNIIVNYKFNNINYYNYFHFRIVNIGQKRNKGRTEDEEFCGWTESDKQAALVTLHLVVQQALSRLWDPPLADDNFVS